jgi:hypothetical protein
MRNQFGNDHVFLADRSCIKKSGPNLGQWRSLLQKGRDLSSGRLAQRYGPVPARERSRLFDAHIENATYFPGVGIAGLDRWSGSMARLSHNPGRRIFRSWRRREVVPRPEEAPRVLTSLIAATDQTITKSRVLIAKINELLRKRR